MAFPDSESWDERAEKGKWNEVEDLLETIFDFDGKQYLTDERQAWEDKVVKGKTMKKWIDFAINMGDESYLEFAPKATPEIRFYERKV